MKIMKLQFLMMVFKINQLNYDLSFVCFNNINWIGNGMTIPAGPLREKYK